MKQLITLTSFLALIFLPSFSHAQTAYSGDTGNYLRLPTSYQQTQPVPTTRPVFSGQGMGQGQLQGQLQGQMPQAAMMQPQQPMMQQAAMPTAVSPRLLPPSSYPMAMQPAMAQPMPQPMAQPQPMLQQPAMQMMQPQLQPASMQPMMATENPHSATQPVAMAHANGIAGSMPMADSTVMGDQSNVQLRPSCDVPDNHRAANKGLNTSTTVHGDCLN